MFIISSRHMLCLTVHSFGRRKTKNPSLKMISEHLAGSVVTHSVSHLFFFPGSLKTAPRATSTGKHNSGWRLGPVFWSSQTPSICLPGQIGTLAVYSLHHILHPATGSPLSIHLLAAAATRPMPIKTPPPAWAKHAPVICQRVIFMGFSHY